MRFYDNKLSKMLYFNKEPSWYQYRNNQSLWRIDYFIQNNELLLRIQQLTVSQIMLALVAIDGENGVTALLMYILKLEYILSSIGIDIEITGIGPSLYKI